MFSKNNNVPLPDWIFAGYHVTHPNFVCKFDLWLGGWWPGAARYFEWSRPADSSQMGVSIVMGYPFIAGQFHGKSQSINGWELVGQLHILFEYLAFNSIRRKFLNCLWHRFLTTEWTFYLAFYFFLVLYPAHTLQFHLT